MLCTHTKGSFKLLASSRNSVARKVQISPTPTHIRTLTTRFARENYRLCLLISIKKLVTIGIIQQLNASAKASIGSLSGIVQKVVEVRIVTMHKLGTHGLAQRTHLKPAFNTMEGVLSRFRGITTTEPSQKCSISKVHMTAKCSY